MKVRSNDYVPFSVSLHSMCSLSVLSHGIVPLLERQEYNGLTFPLSERVVSEIQFLIVSTV